MTRKSLLLFVATSIIWGSSFLFIRLAVEHMPPAWVVFGRTLLGAVAGLVLIALGAWLATSRKKKQSGSGNEKITKCARRAHTR